MDEDLYKEIILDHYRFPNNRGQVTDGKIAGDANMMCGDHLQISVKVDKGIITEAKFDGGGCAVSLAAVDMLLDYVQGKKLTEIKKMSGKEIEEMLGVTLSSARKKCAYLGLEVLKKFE